MIRQSPSARNLHIPAYGFRIAEPMPPGVALPWYLAGGISAANCIAAYQGKGAASYAAARINLSNPGTYNLTDVGAGSPSWDSTNGFIYPSTSCHSTGIVPASGWSAIMRTNIAVKRNVAAFGIYQSATVQLHIYPYYTDNKAYFRDGGAYNHSTYFDNGVLAVTPTKAYANGSEIGTLTGSWSGTTTLILLLGGLNSNLTTYFWWGNIQAFAIYDVAIDSKIPALTTAINAL